MTKNLTVGISTEDHKLASLFFEKIVPINSVADVPKEVKYILTRESPEFRTFRDKNTEFDRLIRHYMYDVVVRDDSDEEFIERSQKVLITGENIIASNLHDFLAKRKISSVPIFHNEEAYEGHFTQGTKEALEIKFLKVPMINTSNIEWKHILDVRKDKNFKRQLRNFRLFLCENYEGKDSDYIADDLERKMEEYESSCRRHGLQLVLSSIRQVLDSNSMLGYLGLVTIGILTGQPQIVGATIAGGTVIELSKITVQAVQKHLDYLSDRENSELAYLIKINEKFK